MSRIRSRQVETESANRRVLKRGSVSTSKIPARTVREGQRWPGSVRVDQKQLSPLLVAELDVRFQDPWAISVTSGVQAFAAAGTLASWTGEKPGPVTVGFVT